MSEIDLIFGSSSGSKNAQKNALGHTDILSSLASPSSSTPTLVDKKKKKKKAKSTDSSPSSPPKPTQPTADSGVESAKKQKKSKKNIDVQTSSTTTITGPPSSSDVPPSTKKRPRPVPETIIDPSTRIEAAAATNQKKRRVESASSASAPSTEGRAYAPKTGDADEERFRDSRGTGPRRKTEEGFSIYKEDELGINDDVGGDTPLCPFDCDCCF